eukprot:tig00000498_g1659.t1
MPPRRGKAKKQESGSEEEGSKSSHLAGLAFAFGKSAAGEKSELSDIITGAGGEVLRSFTKKATHYVCAPEDIAGDIRAGVHYVAPSFVKASKDKKADEAAHAVKPAEEGEEEDDDAGSVELYTAKGKAGKGKAGKRKGKAADEDEDEDEEPAKKGKAAKKSKKDEPPPAKPAASSPAVKKVVRKGRAVVDEHAPDKESYHVYDDGTHVYAVMLNQTDITYGVSGHNKFYVIQLLEHDKQPGKFAVFTRWGRVGVAGQQATKACSSIEAAKAEFNAKFKDKTSNVFGQAFTHKKGKYDLIEIDYGVDQGDEDELDAAKAKVAAAGAGKPAGPAAECKLEPRVKSLVELISNRTMFEQTLVSMHIDVGRMPLGKLSKRQIKEGYFILKQIEDLLAGRPVESGATLEDLSSKFYMKIPHDFGFGRRPPVINSGKLLDEPLKLLAVLADMEIAQEIIGDSDSDAGLHHLDRTYRALKADIVPCDPSSKDWHLVDKMVRNTHAPTHSSYSLELLELFRVDRAGERDRFAASAEIPNKRLLWHGSRLGNFMGILSQGLRIAPPEAPVTGYMFGKGVYFADLVSKSANYCATSSSNPTGLMLLSEVALGNMYEITEAEYMEKAPKGKHSTFGMGKMGPDPAGDVTLEGGVVAHTGTPVDTNRGRSLLYNEYIVYDVAQVNIKYLVKLNFAYKH